MAKYDELPTGLLSGGVTPPYPPVRKGLLLPIQYLNSSLIVPLLQATVSFWLQDPSVLLLQGKLYKGVNQIKSLLVYHFTPEPNSLACTLP